MGTVRQEAKKYVESKGAVIRLLEFERSFIKGAIPISRNSENIAPNIVGIVVDSMVRFHQSGDVCEAFKASFQGIINAEQAGEITNGEGLAELFRTTIIYPTDEESIRQACKLAQFDKLYRKTGEIEELIEPNDMTITHIKLMVERSINFFESEFVVDAGVEFGVKPKKDNSTGEIISDKCTGYTPSVFNGEADYLTMDGLWDLKVLSGKPSNVDIIQLVMYWIMSQHAKNEPQFDGIDIQKIGFYNPREQEVYIMRVDDIDKLLVLLDYRSLSFEYQFHQTVARF